MWQDRSGPRALCLTPASYKNPTNHIRQLKLLHCIALQRVGGVIFWLPWWESSRLETPSRLLNHLPPNSGNVRREHYYLSISFFFPLLFFIFYAALVLDDETVQVSLMLWPVGGCVERRDFTAQSVKPLWKIVVGVIPEIWTHFWYL